MGRKMTKGLDGPQKGLGEKSMLSAKVTPAQKRRIKAAADLRGIAVQRLIAEMIDGLDLNVIAEGAESAQVMELA